MIQNSFFIKLSNILSFLICILYSGQLDAQKDNDGFNLMIGDNAPHLLINDWIKGGPVTEFKKGKIYIVEFWATWCLPCIEVIPHLSKISKKYKKNVTVISINVFQKDKYPRSRAKAIIDSLGSRVKYNVAFDENGQMENEWLNNFRTAGVPSSFIINGDGRISWFGHPENLIPPLKAILSHSWNIDAEAKRSELIRQINQIDDSLGNEMNYKYHRSGSFSDYYGEPDSIIYHINKVFKEYPNIKYGDLVTYYYFTALVKTDMKMAISYAREAIHKSNIMGPQFSPIIQGIKYMSNYMSLTPELYEFGGELMEKYGGKIPMNLIKASEWYWLGGNKRKARFCSKKAVKSMKSARDNGYGTFF